MAYEAKLVVGNKRRDLLTFRVHYFEGRSSTVFNWSENACLGEDTLDSLQKVISQDHHGFRPKPGLPYGGLFEITMESSSDDDFFYDWFTPSKKFGTPIKNGVIEFYDDGEDQVPFKRMEFWDGWVTDISETMSSTGRKPMIIRMRISAATVRYNKSVVTQKNWYQTQVTAQQGISPLSKASISNVVPVASVGSVAKVVTGNSLLKSLEKSAIGLANSLGKTAVKSLKKEGTVEKIVEWVVEKVEDVVKEKNKRLKVERVFWTGRDLFEDRKDMMLNHKIKLQIQLSNYEQGDSVELTVKHSKGRKIKSHATEFKILGACDKNGLIVIDNFKVECDFREDNQSFGKIQFYHEGRKIEEFEENFGWEYIRENGVTKIFVNVKPDINYLALGCTEKDYKNAIQEQFKRTLELSSNGSVTGKIFFSSPYTTLKPPQATVSLKIFQEVIVEKKEGEVSGAGSTTMNSAEVDSQTIDDGLLLMNLGETSVHELLHTLRLDHPQTTTQSDDCKIIHESGVSFKTTQMTDHQIYYNIMIYGFLRVDGNLLSNLWKYKRPEYLTTGQLKFMIEEIDRQKRGDGSEKANHNYSNYWAFPPGEYVNLNK